MEKRVERKKVLEDKARFTPKLAEAPSFQAQTVKQTLTVGQKVVRMLKSKTFWGIWGVIGTLFGFKYVVVPKYKEYKLQQAEEFANILHEQRQKRAT